MIKDGDLAHELLLPFIRETEELLRKLLKSIDPHSSCRIIPAPDLGFPHDVIRLAGGFPTGCLVEWDCSVPFVPIDTTVNIDTSSIFILDKDISGIVDGKIFEWLREVMSTSSYLFNFHKGNHFISFGKRISDQVPVLVIHSNEKEFKYQFNGLMPGDSNWFSEYTSIFRDGNRYLRYIVGDNAKLFVDMAKSLEEFNIIRHRFVAHLLTRGKAKIVAQEDHHHYYMPTRQSVAIGCFPIRIGTKVPVFSRPGKNIAIFSPTAGGANTLSFGEAGEDLVLVPHGWGKTSQTELNFIADYDERNFELSGRKYEIKPIVTLGIDERLELRNFSSNSSADGGFFDQIAHYCPGQVVDQIVQLASFSKAGFVRHEV
jgi:hypothetical protein